MSRPRKPWLRKSNKCWYVEVDGKQVNLGRNKKEAHQRFHKLMAEPRKVAVSSESVVVLIDIYLEWCQKHRAEETYTWYFDLLQQFAKTIDRNLRYADLRPFHVQQWVDSRVDWKKGTQRNAIASVKRVFNWAMEQGYIDTNPIALMTKPQCGKKELLVPEDHYKQMLEFSHDEDFPDLLIVHWETGCRPQESLRVEAEHVDQTNQRWVIPTTPGKPDNRVVYLTDEAFVITQRRMLRFWKRLVTRIRNRKKVGRKPFGINEEEQRAVDRIRVLNRKLPKHLRRSHSTQNSSDREHRRSFQTIANCLNAEDIHTRTGKPWSAATVRNLILRMYPRRLY